MGAQGINRLRYPFRLAQRCQKLSEVNQPFRPTPSIDAEPQVAVHAAVEEHRTPGLREYLCTFKVDAVIVVPRNDRAGVGQAHQEHAAETLQRADGARRHRPGTVAGATKNTPATLFTASGCSKVHFITSVVPALCGTSTTGFGTRIT